MSFHGISPRSRAAIWAGRAAGWASRTLGRGSGGMIGGRVALRLAPELLADISEGRSSVIVTGTNGKSTTTRMVRAALAQGGDVASNMNGDNMTPGITAALLASDAPYAALEVDEMHVPEVAHEVDPRVMILLNLSRDQIDRVGEIGNVERRLRQAVDAHPRAVIVANCDDPLVASAAWDAPNVVWVSAGNTWMGDSSAFPRGGRVLHSDGHWRVVPLDFSAQTSDSHDADPHEGNNLPSYARPRPQWWLEDVDLSNLNAPRATVCRDSGERVPLTLALPGRANLGNALQAIAAAQALGISVEDACRAIGDVREIAGRYSTHDIEGRIGRLMLAKNPAGWQEAMFMIDPDVDQVIVAVNGQVPDGQDLSWLWDVDFSRLKAEGRRVIACGERGADLAVRLEYAGIHCDLVPLPMDAVRLCSPGKVELLLNYTALRDFKRVLDQREGAGHASQPPADSDAPSPAHSAGEDAQGAAPRREEKR